MTPTRPALRWHGGKWMLAPWIIEHLPPHRIYVEPYGGGCSVLLRKPRSYAEVYNDLDGEVVNFFRVLQSPQAPELVRLLELTPFAREEFHRAYEPTADPLERARRMAIRSHMGFGSDAAGKGIGKWERPGTGFRANSNRSGTTPARDWMNYPPVLRSIIARLRGVVIEHRDAVECMAQHDSPDTLYYVDPPYVHETRSKQRGTYAHEMTDADHARLLDYLRGVRGAVVLSGYRHPLYDALGWERVERKAYADGARARTECLWLNPRAAESQARLL